MTACRRLPVPLKHRRLIELFEGLADVASPAAGGVLTSTGEPAKPRRR